MKLYCSTYAKYASGNLFGAWLDLEDYSDYDDFMEACAELHEDEDDPEFMFQDHEGFPKWLYSESSLDPAVYEFVELSEDDQKIVDAYVENVGYNHDLIYLIEQAQEAYRGEFDSDEDFAEDLITECDQIPDHLSGYIDWTKYARDLMMDYFEANGMYFRHL
jgi:antirestriction protein